MQHDPPSRIFRLSWTTGLCLLLAVASRASAATWQVTFGYDDQRFSFVSAAPVAVAARNTSSPGSETSPLKLGYTLEWQDASGQTLQRVPIHVPVGLRSVSAAGTGLLPHQVAVPPSGAFILRVAGPDDPTQPRRLRLLKTWTSESIAPNSAIKLPNAFAHVEQSFALPEFVPPLFLPRPLGGPVRVTKVQDTGPDTNRLVLVVMGDGFTAADLAAGAFSSQVNRFLSQFFATSPWDTYRNAVNVYQVDLASNESGADYEDAAPGSGGTLRDTYLNAQFWAGGLERCVYLDSTGITRAFAAADSLVGVGVWDKVLVFVNSAKYGGCGGVVGVSSLHPSADEIQIHEFGHSFGALADEYDYGSSSTNCVETTLRNVDCGFHLPNVKWSPWVTPGTPLPTPSTADYANSVGAFEGGLYQARGIFRPMLDCKMRTLGTPFCPVCREAHVLKLFERIDLAGGAVPVDATVEVATNQTRVFAVDALPVVGIAYRWSLDGVELAGESDATLALRGDPAAPRNALLQVSAAHTTPLVRAQPLQSSHSWNLTFTDLPTIRASDVAVLEGDAGTNEVRVTFTLSSPGSQVISVDVGTQDSTAGVGADYLPILSQLVFQPGEVTKTVSAQVLGDVQPEGNEVFLLKLGNPVNAKLAAPQVAITITDDDLPPVVAFNSPLDGAVLKAGQPVPIGATASAPGGQITRVDFLADGQTLASLTSAPYAMDWAGASMGTHTLVAVATDGAGRTATSAAVQITVVPSAEQRFALVPLANAWKYDATTNDYGSAWTQPAYDDSVWSGPSSAVFFVGNLPVGGPKNTPIALTSNGARIRSFYFRTHFTFPAPPQAVLALTASNLVDDGAVFYLNGIEAGRLRMPAGDVIRTTFASPGTWATNFDVIQLDSKNLVQGDNVLAVELHLASDTSFPATFGMSLEAVTGFTASLERLPSAGVKRRLTDFLGGNFFTLASISSVSDQGGAVSADADWVYYSPPPGFTSADSFSFTVRDAQGNLTPAFAVISIIADQATTANLRAETQTDGSVRLHCDGIPGQTYAVEFSETLSPPYWQRLADVVADEFGEIVYLDRPATSSPRFYRTVVP